MEFKKFLPGFLIRGEKIEKLKKRSGKRENN